MLRSPIGKGRGRGVAMCAQHARKTPNLRCLLANVLADLLDKLSGERGRWAQQLHAIDLEMQQLPASALLFAAFVTHLPSRSEDVREALMATWARCAMHCWQGSGTSNACRKLAYVTNV